MKKVLFIGVAMAALCGPGVAFGQTTPETGASSQGGTTVGDVVVTAQRRDENAQDVAISMTVVTPEQLANIQTGADISKLVPNVQLDTPLGMGLSRPSIRGIAQYDFNAAATTSNMLYIDEIPLNAAISQGVPIWDLARAEVLRGPQGTLFGRNATGGAIRFISARPTSTQQGYADVTIGRFGERNVRAAVRGPISSTLGARLSFLSQHSNGEYFNVTRNKAIGGWDRYGVRAVFAWQPTDTLDIDLNAQYFRGKGAIVRFKSTPGLATRAGFSPNANGFTSIAQIQAAYGFQNLGPGSNFKLSEIDADPRENLTHIPIQLTANLDMGFATLTSVSGYLDVDHDYITDVDSTPAPILTEFARSGSKQWTQEFRLTSPTGGRFDWIAGVFYMHEKLRGDVDWDATAWLGNMLSGFPNSPTVMYTRGVRQTTESYAAFLHTNYAFTDVLKLNVAGRFTRESKDITYRFRSRWSFATSAPRTSLQFYDFVKAVETGNRSTLLQAAQTPLSGDRDWSNFSWKVGLDYQPNRDLLVYGFVSRGFKGGAFKPTANVRTEVLDSTGRVTAVNPEIVTDYEIGFKSDLLQRKLRLNGGLFYYDYKDYQTNQLDTATVTQVLSNLRKAEVYGAELEVTAVPVQDLTLTFSGGLIHTEIKEALDPSLVGKRLPQAANANFNASISYRIRTPIGDFTPEASVLYRGNYFTKKENELNIPGYTLFDARIDYNNADSGLYGSLWVRNIGNNVALVNADDFTEFFGDNHANFVPRRTYGITAGTRF